jgi:hypothetical protein
MTQSYSRYPQFNDSQFSGSHFNASQQGSQRHGNVSDKEQAFADVIAAISEGKYSWACVLMLRASGYNPLHYMPYRTYNRIIKANLKLGSGRLGQRLSPPSSEGSSAKASCDYAIADLPHLEPTPEKETVRGGRGVAPSEDQSWWSALVSRTVGARR